MLSVDEILEQANVQGLRNIIFHEIGTVEYTSEEKKSYSERLETVEKKFTDTIYTRFKSSDISDEIMNSFYEALTEYQDIYTELGMKLGAGIVFDLLKQ